ncbi:endonuclease V [Nocardiopsis sp. L17-MgMaSL7]|uniref:endonuclease V n=1 Tax=Nocardiopsis sp. L17-MgMaSL7 TaxID=1938893 RepID=UPI000D71D7CF|nr:endonuclease V [Nocardiopsis sp. L17-MgMaSL7]PWV52758.1 endonuclease V [Nocardiopsis sp. L17-MgMaSL7]
MSDVAQRAAQALDDPENWPSDPKEAVARQRLLADRVRTEALDPDSVRYVAGLDVSYGVGDKELAAAAVVLDARTLEVVDTSLVADTPSFPYISGLFAFRELPPVLRAIEGLSVTPDVFVCDGFGLAHPRRFGIASHLGVLIDAPVVGSAKSVLYGRNSMPGEERGSWTPMVAGRSELVEDTETLAAEGGEVIGRVLRTRARTKPVYVSVGHRVDLEGSADLILRVSPKYRVPEPIRHADRLCGQYRKEHVAAQGGTAEPA